MKCLTTFRAWHSNCLKGIRSDNRTEFRNASFDQFCLEHGVDQQFSAPRVPQQNGVLEHKNRTLVEMARTMLDEHITPMRFWAEAINTACYISNQIFLHSLLNLAPLSFALNINRRFPILGHLDANTLS
jgi:transposase InsO family protein